MAEVIVEVIHLNRVRRDFRKFQKNEITIGRGFENDLILSDPHVSAQHLRVKSDDDGWLIEDLNSENGTFVRKFARVAHQAHLQSGDEIKIGKTRLRFYAPSHRVEPTTLLLPRDSFLKRLRHPSVVFLSVWGVFVLNIMEKHLASAVNLSFDKLASGALAVLVTITVWAGIWAFVGHLIRHKAHFTLQLAVTCLFYIAMTPVEYASNLLGYLASNVIVETVVFTIFFALFFIFLLIGHLGVATHLNIKKRVVSSSLITILIISTITLMYMAYRDEYNPLPKIYTTLCPPLWKVVPSAPINEFLGSSDKIFAVD